MSPEYMISDKCKKCIRVHCLSSVLSPVTLIPLTRDVGLWQYYDNWLFRKYHFYINFVPTTGSFFLWQEYLYALLFVQEVLYHTKVLTQEFDHVVNKHVFL